LLIYNLFPLLRSKSYPAREQCPPQACNLGVELGEMGDKAAPAEEAVLGQVDVMLALELAGDIGEVRNGNRSLVPAAGSEPAGDGDPAPPGRVQGQSVIVRGAQV
jgi:hypothetical protein